jgi:hypothetical protein
MSAGIFVFAYERLLHRDAMTRDDHCVWGDEGPMTEKPEPDLVAELRAAARELADDHPQLSALMLAAAHALEERC